MVHEMAVLVSSKAHFSAKTVFSCLEVLNEAAMFVRRFVICVGSWPRPTSEIFRWLFGPLFTLNWLSGLFMTFQILYDFLKLSISIAFLYISLQRGKNVRIRLTSANPYIGYTSPIHWSTICNLLPILVSRLASSSHRTSCILERGLWRVNGLGHPLKA